MPAPHTSRQRRGTASSPSRLLNPAVAPRPAGPQPATACSAHIVSVEQTLDNHAITPLAVEPAVTPVDADDPESAAFVQRETRGVLGENPGHDLPESALGVGAA